MFYLVSPGILLGISHGVVPGKRDRYPDYSEGSAAGAESRRYSNDSTKSGKMHVLNVESCLVGTK